jgi:hypothetical protein
MDRHLSLNWLVRTIFHRDDNFYITLDFAFAAESNSGFDFICLGSKECRYALANV